MGQKVINELNRERLPSKHQGEIVRDSTLTLMALPYILIVVPTRELAIQVYNEMVDLSSGTWIQPAALYGGTSSKEQASMLASGCDILVGTPSRLIDMLHWSYIDGVKTLSLEYLSHMVWDEADELRSLGFAEEVDDILKSCLSWGRLYYRIFSSQYQAEHIAEVKSLMADEHHHVDFDMPRSVLRLLGLPLTSQNFPVSGQETSNNGHHDSKESWGRFKS